MDLSNFFYSSVLNAATEQNQQIVALHVVDLVVSILIGLLVGGLMAYASWKFRYRGDAQVPVQDHGNPKYETLWTLGSAAVVIFLCALTFIVMRNISPPPAKGQQPDVIVNAHQFWWEYRYPKSGVVTANELYLPVGQQALLEIRAADVAHSFWIPDWGEKMDAIPGRRNYVWYKPTKVGQYKGACSEFCGADHSLMRIVANVVPADQFDAWIQSQQKVPTAGNTSDVSRGRTTFMSATCQQCHAISGTDAKSQIAPDLTHISDRKTIGSGLLTNNTENLTRWIMNPQKFKPGCYMPNMRLSYNDAHDIAVYLESLK